MTLKLHANKNRSEIRPGYQDVIVKNAVDVKSQRYVSGVGDYFPVSDVPEPTQVTSGKPGRWQIIFRDTSTGKERSVSFTGEMSIGRIPPDDVRESRLVVGDDAMVSKNHCMIGCTDRSVFIYDLGSTNGTYLNGNKLTRSVWLNEGDRIGVGGHEYVVRIIKE